jgi:hypothetical protein
VRRQVSGLGPWTSESGYHVSVLFSLPFHLPDKLTNAYNGAPDRAAPDFLDVVAHVHAQRVETPVK